MERNKVEEDWEYVGLPTSNFYHSVLGTAWPVLFLMDKERKVWGEVIVQQLVFASSTVSLALRAVGFLCSSYRLERIYLNRWLKWLLHPQGT